MRLALLSRKRKIFRVGRNLRKNRKLTRSRSAGNLPRSHSKLLLWLRLNSGFLRMGPVLTQLYLRVSWMARQRETRGDPGSSVT